MDIDFNDVSSSTRTLVESAPLWVISPKYGKGHGFVTHLSQNKLNKSLIKISHESLLMKRINHIYFYNKKLL